MKNLLLSATIGDIAGSTYEFRRPAVKDPGAVALFNNASFYTDDTVCTHACAEALLDNKDMAETLWLRCRQEQGRGYGGRFLQWLSTDERKPYNSWGNGSAMRCSAAGWLARTKKECKVMATATAIPTHNHPDGVKGAVAAALAVFYLKCGKDKDYVRQLVLNLYYPDWGKRSYADFHDAYHFDVSCQGTVGPAIICFLESKDYADCLRLAIALGGDADTLAAIAGPMAYAYYRTIPEHLVSEARAMLPDWMLQVGERFDEACMELI